MAYRRAAGQHDAAALSAAWMACRERRGRCGAGRSLGRAGPLALALMISVAPAPPLYLTTAETRGAASPMPRAMKSSGGGGPHWLTQ